MPRDSAVQQRRSSVARSAHLVMMRWLLQKEFLHSVTASASLSNAWMQQW